MFAFVLSESCWCQYNKKAKRGNLPDYLTCYTLYVIFMRADD